MSVYDQKAADPDGYYDGVSEFEYDGRVNILGWTFELRADGQLWIDTSVFTPTLDEDGKTMASMRLGPSAARVLRALLDMRDGPPVTPYPPGTRGVGVPHCR